MRVGSDCNLMRSGFILRSVIQTSEAGCFEIGEQRPAEVQVYQLHSVANAKDALRGGSE